MFNDDFEFFDDVSEHANLPKVLTNSPNLFNKKTSIFNFNGNTTTFTKVEKKQNLNNRKILNKNIKLTLEIEESHINKSHNIIYSNKNKLLFSQKLPIHKELSLLKLLFIAVLLCLTFFLIIIFLFNLSKLLFLCSLFGLELTIPFCKTFFEYKTCSPFSIVLLKWSSNFGEFLIILFFNSL